MSLINTVLGADAMVTGAGMYNTAIGCGAGKTFGLNSTMNTTANKNTFLGCFTDCTAVGINNSTAVGHGALITSSNQIKLGTLLDTVQVDGDLTVSKNTLLRDTAIFGSIVLTGNIIIGGGFTPSTTNIYDSLDVSGATSLNATTIDGLFNVSENTTIGTSVKPVTTNIYGPVNILSDTLNVNGYAVATNLNVRNDATIAGNTTITNNLVVNGSSITNRCFGVTGVYNTSAITLPTQSNGISVGTGDGASYSTFNTAINSWYSVGFVDTCNKVCKTYINVRSGGIFCVATNQTSDYRIKKNVIDLKDTEMSVDKLRPISYYNSHSEKQDMGFIAHEVQAEFPFLVEGEKDGEDLQSLNYTGLIPLLVKEIQELKDRVKMLEGDKKL